MRYIFDAIRQDLNKKMVFIGGPRQVGKTTLAKSLLETYPSGRYFNWDYDEDRQAILQKKWRKEDSLLVFDELHKYPKWKSWLKGLYDVIGYRHHILVTGSARLDVYKQGGDSLLGRYHYWRLHPFTLDEAGQQNNKQQLFQKLMQVGGFPEPFFSNNPRDSRRWRKERFDRILQEDIRDLESIKNIQQLRMFLDLLRSRTGGMIVLANLARDIQVSAPTLKSWLDALERMYLLFKVLPYTHSIPRAIHKPPKVYFFDNADLIGDKGAIFENLVATHLLKRLHFLEDYSGYRYQLCYIRDKESREVDFAIVREGKLIELIEVKYHDDKPSKALRYYHQRLQPEQSTQIVATLEQAYDVDDIRITSPFEYFSNPPWQQPQGD